MTHVDELIAVIENDWSKKPGASMDDIMRTEDVLGVRFPADYQSFLRWSNGGEGDIGGRHFALWDVDSIPRLNRDYALDRYLPGVVGIGTDGGGICYALDYSAGPDAPKFVHIPLGDLDPAAVVLGHSFQDGLERALAAVAPDEEDEQDEYDVIVIQIGNDRLDVLKVVHQATGLPPQEAKQLLSSVPATVLAGVPGHIAEGTRRKLEEAGATVELQ